MGDQEPGALSRYIEFKFMVDAMDSFVMTDSINAGPFELCKFMNMAPEFREERRVVDDAFNAYASIALFFDTDKFLGSTHGKEFVDSPLLKQAERAKTVPDRRTHKSNKTMPKEFWDDFDKLLRCPWSGARRYVPSSCGVSVGWRQRIVQWLTWGQYSAQG
jgi:hypothetical protein